MKPQYILLISFLLPCCVFAQTSTQTQKDSLRLMIVRTEGKEKLDTYMRLTNIYYAEAKDKLKRDTLFALYDELDAEAVRQGNDKQRAVVRANKLLILNGTQQYDEVIRLAPGYLEFVEKIQDWNKYYQLYNPYIAAFRAKGEGDTALALARTMYEHAKAKQHRSGMGLAFYYMAQIYSLQRRFSEQEECLRECITLIKDSIATINILPNAYNQLSHSLTSQKRYDEAIRIADETLPHIRRYEEVSRLSQPNAWLNLFKVYLGVFIQSGQFDKAEIYCNKIDSISNGTFPLQEERAAIYLSRKHYDKALAVIDKGIDIASPEEKLSLMGRKMLILIEMGDVEASQQLFRDIVVVLDARHNTQMNAQLDEIRTLYEVDKINAEKERIRNYLLFALAGCLLLALILGIYIYYNRLIKNKNRGLYRQIKEQDHLAEELERIKQLYEKETATAPIDDATPPPFGDLRQRQLVANFSKYLSDERHFSNAEIDFDVIISALATNRSYFFEAVKAVTGKTPKDYIHAMRLEEAKQMLETRYDLTVEVIAEECGFNSRSAFYRHFRERYQMNPTEYRKISLGQ